LHSGGCWARFRVWRNEKKREYIEAESIDDGQDQTTLAAIQEGIKAADEGRLVPEEEVRKLIPQWISKFSTQNPR
jgi:predicted transcriptional regulator